MNSYLSGVFVRVFVGCLDLHKKMCFVVLGLLGYAGNKCLFVWEDLKCLIFVGFVFACMRAYLHVFAFVFIFFKYLWFLREQEKKVI